MKSLRRAFLIFTIFFFVQEGNSATCTGSFSVMKRGYSLTATAFADAANRQPSRTFVRISALTDLSLNPSDLGRYHWRIINRNGAITTMEGPAGTEQFLSTIPGIRYVQPPFRIGATALMDTARRQCGLNEVQGIRPSNLPRSYSGKGVLIGIIDTEFDTHHPAFVDSTGKTRIIALWDQTDATNASPPQPFGYGTAKYGNQLNQDSLFGLGGVEYHGTGMLSYAGGSDRKHPFWGAAPGAMLACVKYNDVGAVTIDGLTWLFHLADSLSVPCVVNMSIGIASGPHDGTSLVDQAIDGLGAAGKIIVGAAGNDGNMKNHIRFSVTSGQSKGTFMPHTVETVSQSPLRYKTSAAIDLWGDPNKNITARLYVVDSVSGNYQTSNQFTSYVFNNVSGYLPDTVLWPTTADTTIFYITGDRRSTLNTKPHLEVYAFGNNPRIFAGVYATISTGGTIHGWSMIKKPLRAFGLTGFFAGDSSYTVNEVGGTAKRIICVGGFVNKTRVTLWDGTPVQRKADSLLYGLAEYTSFGPTADGRTKPDFTAACDAVVGALSRDATLFNELIVWPDTAKTTGRYCINGGTSVSAPLTAGIIALMLEEDSSLTPEEVVQILKQTATKDSYTGTSPNPNTWGAGKVNALGAMQNLTSVPVKAKTAKSPAMQTPPQVVFRDGNLFLIGGKFADLSAMVVQVYSLQGKQLVSAPAEKKLAARTLGMQTVIVKIKKSGATIKMQTISLR